MHRQILGYGRLNEAHRAGRGSSLPGVERVTAKETRATDPPSRLLLECLAVEEPLRRELGDLDQAAKEAALVEVYRRDKLTRHQLSQALGRSRPEVDGMLEKHKVTGNLLSVEEFQRQVEDLRRLADS